MNIKKLINTIKDGFQKNKETKKEEINLKIGTCFYNLSKNKCYITHILKDEPKVQIIYKSYYRDIKQTIYYIKSMEDINFYLKEGDYKLCKRSLYEKL